MDLAINGEYAWGARVGANVDDARQFVGLMDEFYLYNRTLTDTEIATLAGLTTPETPLLGDANLDRIVDDKDASILGKNWKVATGATWFMGDFNADGAVNDKDAAIMAAHWGESLPTAGVPEPSTVVLLLGAVAALRGLATSRLSVTEDRMEGDLVRRPSLKRQRAVPRDGPFFFGPSQPPSQRRGCRLW